MNRGNKGHGRRRPNFWQDWHEEQHRWWKEHGPPEGASRPPGPPPPPMARAWRQFFHDFTGDWPEDHWALGGRRFSPWHQGIDSFNPFVASALSKGGGLLPLLVLVFLGQQPRYGNELMDLLAEQTGGNWLANPGAVYPLMTMLEQQGLVEGEWPDPRKRTVRIYRLTAAGQQEMERLKAIVRPKLEEAVAVLGRLAQELDGGDGDKKAGDEEVIYL